MTQEQLAFAAELDRTYISQLERDKKSPTLDVLFRICDALGIRLSELIARIEAGIAQHRMLVVHCKKSSWTAICVVALTLDTRVASTKRASDMRPMIRGARQTGA